MQSLTPKSVSALTNAGTSSPVASGINQGIVGKPPVTFASKMKGAFNTAGQRAREKPLESMALASALSPQQQQQQPVVVAQPYQQQQMAPPPSVEEKIAASGGSGPTFIPRGLFQEARNEFDEEERYNMQARRRALFS